jgi:hypothetical protein
MRQEFTRRCHAVEEAYEFMLAYAARGLAGESAEEPSGRQLREQLGRAVDALTGLGELLATLSGAGEIRPAEPVEAFRRVLERDAEAALAAIQLVLAQPSISSQLVDNLNASIHVRALLTDLFVLDEILTPQAQPAAAPGPSRT